MEDIHTIVDKPERKGLLGKPKRRWEDSRWEIDLTGSG